MNALAFPSSARHTLDQVDQAALQAPLVLVRTWIGGPDMGTLPENKVESKKLCTGCKREVILSEFPSNGSGRRHTKCKECRAIQNREYRRIHIRELEEKRRNRYHQNPETKKRVLASARKAYAKRDKEKCAAQRRVWHAANKDSCNARQREWCRQNPQKVLAKYIKGKYGLTLDDLQRMIDDQGGRCAACREESVALAMCSVGKGVGSSNTAIDHDHATNQVRGLLCKRCNTAIGFLKDSPLRAERVAVYLRKHAPVLPMIARMG